MKYHRRDVVLGIGGALALSVVSRSVTAWQDTAATAKPRIRIGQIGVGHAHASKLSVYRNSPDYEVVGVVESNAELRKRAESEPLYRDLPWMTQEQLLNMPDLQAVLVETEVRDLLNVAEVCVAAGKHVHVDKPAGESLKQFASILESATKQHLLLQYDTLMMPLIWPESFGAKRSQISPLRMI